MTSDLLSLPVADTLKMFKSLRLSPVDLTVAVFDRVADVNPRLNALCLTDRDGAIRQAKASEKRWRSGAPCGALDGIPVTVKDWFHVTGWPTRFGSKLSATATQKTDSPAVARLREAGAVFIGKTTLPEYGHKGVTESPLYGITRNPWDADKTSGGSSGGGAVAAATGMGFLHIGSDAGGSVRIPASFCGVFGFKPSQGIVPSWPPSLFSTLSAIGPMARSVDDAARMMDVLAQPDARDWHALPIAPPKFAAGLRGGIKKLKIAYAPQINDIKMNRDIAPVVNAAVRTLENLGVVDVIRLDVPDVIDVFNKHWMAVASYMVAEYSAAQKKKVDPRLLHWAARGDKLKLHDYLAAERARMAIGEYFKNILDRYDILVTPTTAMSAFDTGTNMPQNAGGKPWEDWTPFTYPANLARLPAASVPVGLTAAGLPVGLQVMSGYLKDVLVLKVSQYLEEAVEMPPWDPS